MDPSWLHFIGVGALLGVSAGLAPGPLLALVIAETLRHGVGAGVRIALAPLVTDLPIILLTWFLLSRLASFHAILGVISLAGGLFVFAMGYGSLRIRGVEVQTTGEPPRSLAKGVLTNLLSPHPYLFWFSVGAPTLTAAAAASPAAPWLFVGAFYLLLVGAKIALALVAGRSRAWLSGPAYRTIMRLLGVMLMVLAGLLVRDGLALLGLVGA